MLTATSPTPAVENETRSPTDQEQVNELKRLAYANGVEELTAGYLR